MSNTWFGAPRPRATRLAGLLLLLAGLAAPARANAQTSTGSMRGFVRDASGAPIPGARIELVNPASGLRRAVTTTDDGFYNLSALPPATYDVRVVRLGFTPQTDTVRVTIAAALRRDYTLTATATQLAAVSVTAHPGGDTRTPEVGMNITPQQIENLPQNNRNFLDFAALAPGVQQRSAGISSGGAATSNANVFVDGASYKSDILPGGVAGQDPSIGFQLRGIGNVVGNPFPQSAVQEFRVITQNYKAEYQKASGAIITAATKSGTNELHGELFGFGQNQNAFARQYWDIHDNYAKPRYHKGQFGGSLGGPIIRDRLHYFASYEGNDQFYDTRVVFRPPTGAPTLPDSLLTGEGVYGTPLHSNLFFGRLDGDLTDRQSLMFSANIRRDNYRRDFGGGVSVQAANKVDNAVDNFLLKHTFAGQPYTNEAQISFQRFNWKQLPENPSIPRRVYESWGVTRGGATSYQDFTQDRLSLRNDLTYTAASHVIKGGANVDFLRYNIDKRLDENPTYLFNASQPGGFDIPYAATLQVGNPKLSTNNQQVGLYIQDDWNVSPRLLLNLGIRWDYESDWLNNSYVTPQWVRDSVAAFLSQHPFFNEADYVSNGNRPKFWKAFQPRAGFSYDVTGQDRTVLFGGGGLFYDRTIYNILLDEKYKSQRPSYRFQFRPPGDTTVPNAIDWQPQYGTRAGLLQLISSGQYNKPEVFLINNDQKPPYSVQASLGVRQALGSRYQFSVTGTLQNNYNLFKWMWGHRDPTTGNLLWGSNGMADILISTDAGRSWYRALLFSLRRPMTEDTRWGGDLNYTLAKTETNTYQDVEDPFALDYTTVNSFSRVPGRFDERHRIVMNLIGRAPLGVLVSTITTLGSGYPFTLSTGCQGPWDFADTTQFCYKNFPPVSQFTPDWMANPPGKGPRSERPEGKWFGPFGKWAYRNVDLRLQKDFNIRDQKASIIFDVFNLFNFVNFNYDNFEYNLRWDTNQGQGPFRERIPFSTYGPRAAQLGARYTF